MQALWWRIILFNLVSIVLDALSLESLFSFFDDLVVNVLQDQMNHVEDDFKVFVRDISQSRFIVFHDSHQLLHDVRIVRALLEDPSLEALNVVQRLIDIAQEETLNCIPIRIQLIIICKLVPSQEWAPEGLYKQAQHVADEIHLLVRSLDSRELF